jgi:hypothetical protein
VVLHNKPLKAPPLDVVLERNVEILCFPPSEAQDLRRQQAGAVLQPSRVDNDKDISRDRSGGESRERPRTDVRKWKFAEWN